MGGEPWMYFVEYRDDVQAALDALREREFRAGRYRPALLFLPFPVDPARARSPGAQHPSIDAAREAAGEGGTASILDIDAVANEPDFGVVAPVADDDLMALYGTTCPTQEMLEETPGFLDEVDRGQGVYVVAYADGKPSKLCFAGYSYD